MRIRCFFIVIIICYASFDSKVYAQDETDTVEFKFSAWKLSEVFNEVDSLVIDTLFGNLKDIYFSESVNKAMALGNDESPYQSLLFSAYKPFLFKRIDFITPDNFYSKGIQYYRTNKPFTDITYQNSGGQEDKFQRLDVLHTQNFSEILNVGFHLNRVTSLGSFTNQDTKDYHLGIWASFEQAKRSFSIHFLRDQYKNNENGGLVSVEDYENSAYDKLSFYPVYLSSAKSYSKRSIVSFIQKYALFKNQHLFISHHFEYDLTKRAFYDSGSDTSFYLVHQLDTIVSFDSLRSERLGNNFQITMISPLFNREVNHTFELKHQMYSQYLGSGQGSYTNINLIYNLNFKKDSLRRTTIRFDYALAGYTSGDYLLRFQSKGKINDHLKWQAELSFEKRKADWLFTHLYLEGISPDDLLPLNKSEIHGAIHHDKLDFDLNLTFGLASNALRAISPVQIIQDSINTNYLLIHFKKDFHIRHFVFENTLDYQFLSKNERNNYPALIYSNDFYFQDEWFHKALYLRLGIDLNYLQAYYLQAYSPLSNLYYDQEDFKSINYPVLSVYGLFKIQSVRIMVKYHHINQPLMNSQFYNAYGYPGIPTRFSFGIRWLFFN